MKKQHSNMFETKARPKQISDEIQLKSLPTCWAMFNMYEHCSITHLQKSAK